MYRLIVVGFSAGGIEPMQRLLAGLSADYPLPLAVVAHLPPGTGASFGAIFNTGRSLPLAFAYDKQPIRAGAAWLAPADYHLLIENTGHFALSVDLPVNYVRPSIDVLFESAAASYGSRLIAVTLSGANSDGAKGMARVKECGGMTIALDRRHTDYTVLTDAVMQGVNVDYCVAIDEIVTLLRAVH